MLCVIKIRNDYVDHHLRNLVATYKCCIHGVYKIYTMFSVYLSITALPVCDPMIVRPSVLCDRHVRPRKLTTIIRNVKFQEIFPVQAFNW